MLNNQQQSVIDQLMQRLNSGNGGVILVDSDPGVGKTHVGVDGAKTAAAAGKTVCVMAFTNENADSFAEKVTHPLIKISTSHKAGMRQFPPGKFAITDKPLVTYLRLQKVTNVDECIRLIGLGKALMIAATSLPEVAERWRLRLKPEDIGICQNAFQLFDAKNPHVDDLIYYPALKGWSREKYDLVIVDEYQDMTLAQIKLARQLVKSGGVLLCLGDKKQAIFGFRGASFQPIPEAVVLEMTLTYRYGQTICDYNNRRFGTHTVPAIEKYGIVTENGDLECDANTMIIARTNAELVPHALRLMLAGKPVYMTNKRLLNDIILRIMNASHNETCPNCNSPLVARENKKAWGSKYFLACSGWPKCKKGCFANKWQSISSDDTLARVTGQLLNDRESADSDKQLEIDDTIAVCRWLLSNYTPTEAIDQLTKLSQSHDGTMLTTCHKAKGLQADRVHVLESGFLKALARAREYEDTLQIEQEINLQFVAMTRAGTHLNIITE